MTLQRTSTSKNDRRDQQLRELQRLNEVYKRERDEALNANIHLKRDLLKLQQTHIAYGIECYRLGWRNGKHDASDQLRELWRGIVDDPRNIPDDLARAAV